ncbi:MAG: polyribonucleotide nucleotidyltransferase [Saprospiraceae bacterium]|nr:polyribonucleotide nucleotidyltransferase [Saprospiraceae bacterium]MCB9327093.1 polyribonucleotide nucleotidyltransferase [Lewinellaceae bacterium]
MGNFIPKSTSFQLPDGKTVTLETGKLATQAHGSVVLKVEKTMLLATVVSNYELKEGQGFFPLSVDYQEKFASAGKIPGNFFRREAKLSDYEVLISRLVDRPVRPLFPDGYMNETQIIINLISGDDKNMPDCYAALAASAALVVSDIPWDGPISEVRVAKINGKYIVNPERAQLADATLDIIVAATKSDVMMVEGEAKECQESELVEAIKLGHEQIKIACDAQLKLAEMVGQNATTKREVEMPTVDEELYAKMEELVVSKIQEVSRAALDKHARKDGFKTISEEMKATLLENMGEEHYEEVAGKVSEYYDKIKKKTIRNLVLNEGLRLDGRKFDEVRPIWSEIDYLPSAHGSAIFNRGETQSLTSLTLGSKLDAMLIDNALENYNEKFILHYNFPALSVGEIKPNRGPGRREVGHANLAGRSLRQVLPDENPYTIRIVSDILESNGSSSMATVCAGSLALMDAGLKIKKAVSGIAMGMISENGKTAILSDILGDEDALGDMDFKVTGTSDGITGCQMDIKIDGLPYEQLEKALSQAKAGRLHILNEMNKTIAEPREDLKEHAPRMVQMQIDKSFIGAVIGPGGKIIQDLQERTQTVITIEEVGDKGIVAISSMNKNGIEQAVKEIQKIAFVPKVGDEYEAVVEQVMPYGVFVKFNGKSGLVHVSELSHSRINDVTEHYKEGDKLKVKYIGDDQKTGKMRLSRKALMPKPVKENE